MKSNYKLFSSYIVDYKIGLNIQFLIVQTNFLQWKINQSDSYYFLTNVKIISLRWIDSFDRKDDKPSSNNFEDLKMNSRFNVLLESCDCDLLTTYHSL